MNKLSLLFFVALFLTPVIAMAETQADLPSLEELQYVEKTDDDDSIIGEDSEFAVKIRRDAMRRAARSYGARGGLAWRTRAIMNTLKENQTALDKTYNFRRLLIAAPSNLLIEPPIISQSLDAFKVSDYGDEAAVSDVIYNISQQARIVAAPRNWRQYLERSFDDDITPPPNLLLPETVEERKLWTKWVAQGWEEGIKQADQIFEIDLEQLVSDFEGMVRYRMLLAQGKVSSPYAVHEDRGITGGGDEMRVGDRAIRISGPAQLRKVGDEWNPANR